MLNFSRFCLRNTALISRNVQQKNYIPLWFEDKQLSQKSLAVIPQCVKQLRVKSTAYCPSHWAVRPVVLSCPKRTYSKQILNTTSGNTKTYQQHNFVQKFSFSIDHKPTLSTGSKATPSNSEHWGPYVVSQIQSQIHRLEESSRFRGYSMLRWGLSGLVVMFTFVYLFRDRLRDNVADEVADVALRSMADENVVLKAHGMTKGVLNRLISEPETIALVSRFFKEVLQKDDVRTTAVNFTASILNHPDTQAKIQEVTSNTLQFIINNEETQSKLLNFIKSLIEDKQTKEACHKLFVSLTEDPKVREMTTEFFKSVLASPKFQMEAIMLGREVTNKIVHDKEIQQDTGDALWSAIKYGVTPYWFREE